MGPVEAVYGKFAVWLWRAQWVKAKRTLLYMVPPMYHINMDFDTELTIYTPSK